MAKEKCVLAYSGGLDTSVCIKWLQDEKNLDVIAVVGEVGQEHEGLEQVKERALATAQSTALSLTCVKTSLPTICPRHCMQTLTSRINTSGLSTFSSADF